MGPLAGLSICLYCQGKCSLQVILRTLLIFSIGFIICFMYMNFEYHLRTATSVWVGSLFGVVVCVLTAWNRKLRCCAVLCLPELASNLGRVLLFSVVTWMVLVRPLTTITLNLKEVSRMVNCVGTLAESQGDHLLSAQQQVYSEITENLKKNSENWNSVAQTADGAISPMISAFRDAQASIIKAQDALTKAAYDCNAGVSQTYSDCRRETKAVKKSCIGMFDVVGGIGSEACTIFDGIIATCEAFRSDLLCTPVTGILTDIHIFESLGDYLKEFRKMFEVKLNMRKSVQGTTNASDSIEAVTSALHSEFNDKLDMALRVYTIIHYGVTIPCILLLPMKAYWYMTNVLKPKRRPGKGEWRVCCCFSYYVPSVHDRTKRHKNQRNGTITNIVLGLKIVLATVITFVFTVSLLAMEYCLHWGLLTAQKFGNFTVGIDGRIDVVADIDGGAVMKPIVESFFDSFKIMRNYTVEISTEECLPKPVPPSSYGTYWTLLALYSLMVSLACTNQYFLSKRANIVRWFFPSQNSNPTVKYAKRTTKVTKLAQRPLRKKVSPTRSSTSSDVSSDVTLTPSSSCESVAIELRTQSEMSPKMMRRSRHSKK